MDKVTRSLAASPELQTHLALYFIRFGAEKGHKAGPDTATTTVGENVRLKLTAGGIKVRSLSVCSRSWQLS